MKALICKAFCDSVLVTELPNKIGFGISSSMFDAVGEQAGIYAIGPDASGLWRLDDSGWVAPMLSASGFDLSQSTRIETLTETIDRCGLCFDVDGLEIYSEGLREHEVPAKAIKFFIALSKISELAGWTHERVRSTFREDVSASLREMLPNVSFEESAPADERAPDLIADLVLRAPGERPVALYLAQTDVPLLEAMLLRSETAGLPDRPKVAAIMESEKSANLKTRTRAHNRLDIVTVFEGDAKAAITRIAQEIAGTSH